MKKTNTALVVCLLALTAVAVPIKSVAADSIVGLGGNNFLTDNASRIWGANVCYTTDGAGNVTPIGSGGGGGGTVTQGPAAATHSSPWWAEITDGTNNAGVTANGLKVDVQASVLPTGAASASNQTNGAQKSQHVDGSGNVQPSGDTAGRAVFTQSVNSSGSISNASVTTTASTFTAPANAVGFVLEAESGNTDNIRWAIGSTATASVGMLTDPGRDTGYVPGAANISVIAISGTQSASVQWVLNH